MLKVFSSVIAFSTIAAFSTQAAPAPDNVLGLFLVKKDLITQQWRGEIYPIAQLKDGKYIDASVNVTGTALEDAKESEIVQLNAAKSILNQPRTFTAVNSNGKPLVQFSSKTIGVGQFACDSYLIGRGQASGTNLATLFAQISGSPQGFEGVLNGKQIKETWKTTIALQNPTEIKQIPVSTADLAKYRAAVIKIGTAEIDKTKEGKLFKGNAVIEELRTIDLDGDGKVEVYAKLRKGTNTLPRSANRPTVRAVYANIWLKYNTQPQLISKQVVPQFSPASDSGREYTVLQAIDLDRDGKNEVLIRNNGYEGVDFSLYQLQGNQLKSVFTGAGYGC